MGKPKELLWLSAVSKPPPGIFDANDSSLQWHAEVEPNPKTKGRVLVNAFYIASDRKADFLKGEERRAGAAFNARTDVNRTNDLHEYAPIGSEVPRCDVILTKQRFHCEFGPEDLSCQGESLPNKVLKRSKVAHGESKKVGCCVEWTVKVFMREDLRQYCRVSCTQRQHTGHGSDSALPQHKRRGQLSQRVRDDVEELALAGFRSDKVIAGARNRLQAAFANDPTVPGGLKDFLNYIEAYPGSDYARDYAVNRDDVKNIKKDTVRNEFKFDPDEGESIRKFVEVERAKGGASEVFCFQDAGPDQPLVIGVATRWQLEQAAQLGHGKAILLDATHSTNQLKYPLFTVMVMDEFGNGLPVGWVLMGGETTAAIATGLRGFRNAVRALPGAAEWEPSCAVVDDAAAEHGALKEVFGENFPIFLCVWHLQRNWLENLSKKGVEAGSRHALIGALQSLVRLGTVGDCPLLLEQQLNEAFDSIVLTFGGTTEDPKNQAFLAYFKAKYMHRIRMWVLAFRTCNHSLQNTTAAIEGYHGSLKQLDLDSDLKRLIGRRLDWLIGKLLRETEARYRQQQMLKRKGYKINVKAEQALTAAIQAAQGMGTACVLISDVAIGNAEVSSPNHAMGYMVAGALTAMPCCSCPAGIKGSICKHLVKVMLMLGKTPASVLKIWGTLRGTEAGDALLAAWSAAPAGSAEHSGGGTLAAVQPQARARDQLVEKHGGGGPVRPVDHKKRFNTALAALQAHLAGQPETDICWETAAEGLGNTLFTVRALQARSNSGLFISASQPAALTANPAAPAGMSRLRLRGLTEHWGRRGKSTTASQRVTASQPAAAAGLDELCKPMLPQQAMEQSGTTRPALRPLRQNGVKRARCFADQKAKLCSSDGSQLLLMSATAVPDHHERLQQAARQPLELMLPGGMMQCLVQPLEP